MLKKIYERIKEKPIIGITVGAFVVRLPFIFFTGPLQLGDERLYNRLAKAIIAGAGYSTSKGPTLYRPPLYPAFLAGLYLIFGPNPVVATVIQAALSAATCYFVFRVALNLWDERTALVAAALWFLGPDMIIFSKLLMTETLFLFFAGLLLWMLVAWRGGWKLSAGIGLTSALAALTRPAVLVFLPFAFAWAVRTRRASRANVVTAAITCALVIAPWTVRNYLVTAHLRLIDTTGGINLYAGNHYDGKGEWYFPEGNPLTDGSLTEVERDELGYRETFKNAVEHPLETLRVIGLKAAYVISPSGEKLYLIKTTAPPPLLWILLSGLFFEVLALGTAGYLARTEKTPGAGALFWYIIAGTAVLVAVVFGERYRMAATYPALVPIAAAGWIYITQKGASRRKSVAVATLLAAQLAAGVYILVSRPKVIENIIKYFFTF